MIFGVQPCVFYYKFIVWKVVEKKYLDLTYVKVVITLKQLNSSQVI